MASDPQNLRRDAVRTREAENGGIVFFAVLVAELRLTGDNLLSLIPAV
jgi:hypothetical protein